jgi:hypothetical protein
LASLKIKSGPGRPVAGAALSSVRAQPADLLARRRRRRGRLKGGQPERPRRARVRQLEAAVRAEREAAHAAEQRAEIDRRITARGLQGRVSVLFQDYATIEGENVFDKISSIGMFEQVGLKNHETYFKTVHRLLKPRGLWLDCLGWRRRGEHGSTFLLKAVCRVGWLNLLRLAR